MTTADAFRAATSGDITTLAALVTSSNVSPSSTDFSGASLLHAAAQHGHSECVRGLLECHADVNHMAGDGTTPLIAAAFAGQAECVAVLLRGGAAPEHCDVHQSTALHWAAYAGHTACVRWLLATRRVSPLARDEDGTPLDFSSRASKQEALRQHAIEQLYEAEQASWAIIS